MILDRDPFRDLESAAMVALLIALGSLLCDNWQICSLED